MDPNTITTPVSARWEENDMIWSVDQCPVILFFNGITLSQCQNFCISVSTCTAINFGDETGHCTLLNCGYPCPEPLWSATNYKGYCLDRDQTTTSDPNETTTTAATTATAESNETTTTAPDETSTTDQSASTTTKSDIWEENDMIWSVDQCPSILWFDGITLIECQNF